MTVHLACTYCHLHLHYTSTGVFSYARNTSGGVAIQHVNCSLAIDLDSNVHFPLRLLLVLTGAILIAVDINVSVLFCFFKYCGCGILTVIWYMIDCIIQLTWTAWSIFYIVSVFPVWQDDRSLCDNLVMISAVIAVGIMCFFALLYVLVIILVLIYECRQRLECCQVCCYNPKYRNDD